MADRSSWDAVVVGSGPNGLVAAITLARTGRRVVVFEGANTPGGGCRTAELTGPGFRHDVCSSVLPLGIGSPALRDLPLERHGVRWVHPDTAMAHPVGRGAALLHHSLEGTVAGLGRDGRAWRRMVAPFLAGRRGLIDDLLSPLSVPRHPISLARFGMFGVWGATTVARATLGTDEGAAMLAGLAAHSVLPIDRPITTGFALTLGALAHVVGWPFAAGGAQSITDALVAILAEHGGEVVCGQRIERLSDLPPAPITMADVSPGQLIAIAGDQLPARYVRRLRRFRHGPGAFKVDYALAGPVPWTDDAVARAGTVHLGGTLAEVAAAEAAVGRGQHPEAPFVLAAQASPFDPTRAPAGQHTLWAYTHVPAGSTVDMTARIEAQIERFAPGFGDLVIDRHVMGPAEIEARNPNDIGGDITGGMNDWRQFVSRPVLALRPWRTPIKGLYLCSASTPPGGGVHGMCGLHAASCALKDFPT
ncbi:MAG: phytoene desaturase family protein [Ilumatobacteraceae bacterium]